MAGLNGVTAYDAIMALIVIFTTVHGFWKGATWQIAPIMSLVLGYMVAMPMSVSLAHYFGDPPQNRLFAMVAIYIGVAFVVYFAVRSFRAGIERAKMTEFDRHIGALLGALKGILLTLSITVILLIYSTSARELILKSESSTIAAKIINAIYPILPQAMHQILRPYLKQLDGELPLDLHDSDFENSLNNSVLPDQPSPLTPTQSGARRSPYDVNRTQRVPRSSQFDDESDDEYMPRTPRSNRRPINPDDEQIPRSSSRRDSATRSNRNYPGSDTAPRYTPDVERPQVVTPIPEEEDDPFLPGKSNQDSRPR
jgi:uncharacterized membrane protein required for colicin V production